MFNHFSTDSILYYPAIELQDETWVKQALMFWDTIYRIVPTDYPPADSYEIEVAKSNGVIKNIVLTDQDLAQAAEKFAEYCEHLNLIPAGFETSDFEVNLHSSKMDKRIKAFFRQYSKEDKRGFYRVPKKIANGYMFFLADSVSKARNIGRITDEADMFAAMIYFDGNGNFPDMYNNKAEESYVTLIIENLMPSLDIESVDMEKIIFISSKFQNWKDDFRKQVCEFNDKLASIQNIEFARTEIRKFAERMIELKGTRSEFLSTFFRDLTSSLLYIGVPTAGTGILKSIWGELNSSSFLTALANNIFLGLVAGFAGAGLSAIKEWSSKRANYFLEIKEHIISGSSRLEAVHFNKLLDQYIND